MVKISQDKWKVAVEVQNLKAPDECDIAWAALELVSARRKECRKNWISSQVDSWLGGMVAQIRYDVTNGIVPPIANPINHICSLQIRALLGYLVVWTTMQCLSDTAEKDAREGSGCMSSMNRFNDNAVRERMMKLMGTETVRILDRNFMATLAERLLDQNWEMTRGRIKEREKWERDREKQMVLDGMIPLSEGPEGFADHPYFAIMRQVADDVAKKKAKIEAHQKRKRMNKMFDYSSLPNTFKDEMDDQTLSALALIQDDDEDDTFDINMMVEETDEHGQSEGNESDTEVTEEGLATVRYEAPEVKNLRKARTVEEMYRLADSIFLSI